MGFAGKAGSLVLIERVHSAARLNEIINHPSVFEGAVGLSSLYPADLSFLFRTNPGLVSFVGEHGAAILFPYKDAPKVYDGHFAVLPQGRGAWCREAAGNVLFQMFSDHDAEAIVFRCPFGNVAAQAGAKMLGAQFMWTTEPVFNTDQGKVPLRIYVLTRARWLERVRRH